MCYNYALGVVHWRIRWDAGAKHGTLRKLDRYHSQLCLATVSACRRRATLTISWEGLWNTRVFNCDRPSGIGERLTAGNSLRPDVSGAFCGRCYLDVSGTALYRYLALSLLSGCVHLHRVRPCRSREPAHVYRYGRNDTHRRSTCLGDRTRRAFHGKFSTCGNSPLSQAIGIVIKPTWTATLGSPYIGPLGLIGTLLATIHFRRLNVFLRMLVVAFGAIGMYGLLSAFGTNLGLAYINFHLPFINRIREADRHLVLLVIGVSFLSGVGYSLAARGLEDCKNSRDVRQLIAPAALLTIFAGIILSELLRSGGSQRWSGFSILASTPILVVLGLIFNVSHYYHVAFAALLVSLAGMVIPVRAFSVSESGRIHATGFNTAFNLLSHRVIKSFADKIDVVDYRVDFHDDPVRDRLWAMNASYYGIKSFYNQLTPEPYGQFRFSNLSNIPHLRAMMGARYVLCAPNTTPIERDAKQILETEGYKLYENPNPMGRLTLVHRVAGFPGSEAKFIKTINAGLIISPRHTCTQSSSTRPDGFWITLKARSLPGSYRKDRRPTESQLLGR